MSNLTADLRRTSARKHPLEKGKKTIVDPSRSNRVRGQKRVPGKPSPQSQDASAPKSALITFSCLSIAAGGLIGLGWFNESMGWMGVVGIAVLLVVLRQVAILPLAVLFGWQAGTVSFLVSCHWMPYTIQYLSEYNLAFSILIYLAMCLALGTKLAVFGLAWNLVRRSTAVDWVTASAILVLLDVYYPSLFPATTACLLTGFLPLLQIAEVGSVHLVSLLVFTMACLAGWSFESGRQFIQSGSIPRLSLIPAMACGAGLIVIYAWGVNRIEQIETLQSTPQPVLKVGLIQADTQYVDSHQAMVDVSRRLESDVDLIVWPESALGDYSTRLTDFRSDEQVYELSRGDHSRERPFPDPNVPLLAGGDVWNPELQSDERITTHVSAMLFNQQEQLIGRHDKNRLMPFGEYIPTESVFPFLKNLFDSDRIIIPSVQAAPIGEVRGITISALLCCEDMHVEFVRSLALQKTDLLVTLGNGTVFNSPTVLEQHFRIARFRAIENRLPHIRCTSKGISGYIEPSGRVVAQLPSLVDGATIVDVRKADLPNTIFQRWGGAIPIIFSVTVVASASVLRLIASAKP